MTQDEIDNIKYGEPMTTHDKDKIIAAAKEAGCELRDEIESLRQQLSNRDAEIAEIVAALDNSIFVFDLDPKIAKALANVRKQ